MLSVEEFLSIQQKKLEKDKEELIAHVRNFLQLYDARHKVTKESVDSGIKCSLEKPSESETPKVIALNSANANITSRNDSSMITARRNISDLHFEDDEPIGLPVGGYEDKRKKLAEERRADYNRYLAEKDKKLQLKKESAHRRNTGDAPTPRSIASMNYQEMLQKKREEEMRYRNINQFDPVDDPEVLRLQSETDRLKSERDNFTALINNLKKIAGTEDGRTAHQSQLSQSFSTLGSVTAPPGNAINSFAHQRPSTILPSSAPNSQSSSGILPMNNRSQQPNMRGQQDFRPIPRMNESRAHDEILQLQTAQGFPHANSFQSPLFSQPQYQPSFFHGNNQPWPNSQFQESIPDPFGLNISPGMMSISNGHPMSMAPANNRMPNPGYAGELAQQVKEKQLRKMKEIEDERRRQQISDFYPWGNESGGGGAPMKDPYGNIITSRKGKYPPVITTAEIEHPLGVNSENVMLPAPNMILDNTISSNREYDNQRKLDRYRDDLRKQIEEKRRLALKEKERQRLEEERLAERIEEQRLRMQREYEEEQAKRNRKEEELRVKQERLMELQEKQRREEENRKREEAERREMERLERQKELEIQRQKALEQQARSKSPPVPTVRAHALEKEKIPLPEPPKDPHQNVLSQLTQMRQQLQDEQMKMNEKLKEQKKKYKVMDRRAVQDDTDDDDEEEIYQLQKNNARSRDYSADFKGHTEKPSRWNKENIKISENEYSDYDVQVENLE